MSSSVAESVFEIGVEFSEANNVLLMSLMEECTQEDEYYGDGRLVSMIQSLEAEISCCDMGHVDGQDCSTSVINIGPDHQYHWVDEMELISSSPYDEMIPCGDNEMEHVAMEYEAGADENIIDDFQMFYGVFLEQQLRETYYLSQGSSDAVF